MRKQNEHVAKHEKKHINKVISVISSQHDLQKQNDTNLRRTKPVDLGDPGATLQNPQYTKAKGRIAPENSYMGVSENSVPLNPLVNDHYPY